MGGGHPRRTALVVAVVVAVLVAVGVGVMSGGGGGGGPTVPPGTSGLPAPDTIRGAIRALAVRLHRVPDLALIQLEPGRIRLQYYTQGRADSGFFINWAHGRFGTPEPFRFPNDVIAPQLRFDPAELRLDGVENADRVRGKVGLGGWRIVRAEGFRRGALISDGSGIVWRITIEHRGKQRYMFTNQAGSFIRIAKVPPVA